MWELGFPLYIAYSQPYRTHARASCFANITCFATFPPGLSYALRDISRALVSADRLLALQPPAMTGHATRSSFDQGRGRKPHVPPLTPIRFVLGEGRASRHPPEGRWVGDRLTGASQCCQRISAPLSSKHEAFLFLWRALHLSYSTSKQPHRECVHPSSRAG